jgi:hypothetical protein
MANESEPSLVQLVYVSEPVGLDDAGLARILVTSRERNRSRGVTGMLLCGHARILQVLEGPRDDVQRLYARIEQDPRHQHCRVLLKRTVWSRDFGEWSMGFAPMNRDAMSGWPGFVDIFVDDFDVAAFQSEGGIPRFVLLAFREQQMPSPATALPGGS